MFFGLGTGQTLSQAFAAAGFHDVKAQRLETRLQYATGDEACEAAFVGGPVALAHDRFPQATRDEAYKEYLASLAPYRDGDGYSVPGEFVVVTGMK